MSVCDLSCEVRIRKVGLNGNSKSMSRLEGVKDTFGACRVGRLGGMGY